MKTTDRKGMNRRAFLKNGVAGTAAAMIATPALAESLMQMAKSEPPEFPAPVYRTLGRTGLKISTVSFGAMLTPEPEVLRVAFDHGVNYVNTSRK